ncbi:MAG: DUF177 domain-containing protein [Gemmatimonadales bacterium]|jgi:uncharacterized protein
MLRVDLGALRMGPVETRAEVSSDDPMLSDLDVAFAAPVRVEGRLTESGSDDFLWNAAIRTTVTQACRRCLAPVAVEVAADVQVLLTDGDMGDDPSTYPIPADGQELELGDIIREELILALPSYVLCREDCRGLCARCGKELNEGPCDCRPEPDPRWAALEELRTRLPDKES